MSEENVQQGNPKAVEDSVFGSNSEDFFSALENDVNGAVQEDNKSESSPVKEATSNKSPEVTEQQTQVSPNSQELNTLKKRYSDSSREAQNLRAQLNELKPFVPVLDAMKQDSGLIEHVRGYFKNGGNTPKNIKEQLNLSEDFVMDPDEMVNKPDSDSAKVFNSMVDKVVKQRASQIIAQQDREDSEQQAKDYLRHQAQDFQQRYNMSDEQFSNFIATAERRFQEKGMTFDDMYTIMNKGAVNQNVANSTKEDMLNQMRNVREMPVSQSSANSQQAKKSDNDNVFDALASLDGGLDEMFNS